MTQLVDDLKARLLENAERDFFKAISLNCWFTGQDVEDDIAIFQEAFRRNGLGKDDVVFMALENSAVYIPMNQAMWRYGITAHPVASTTLIAELVADYDENQYPAMIFNQEKAAAFKENAELRYEVLHLKTFPDLVLLSRKDNDNTHKEMTPTEDTLGWILNTSGMTGKFKQIGLLHRFMRLAGEDNFVLHRMTKEVDELLSLVGLSDFANHSPDHLSGG